MTPFLELFRSHSELLPGEQQRQVELEFPDLVAQGPLHWWSPGEEIVTNRRRLLIGVAAYSEMDMRLLDQVREAVAGRNGLAERLPNLKVTKDGVSVSISLPNETLGGVLFGLSPSSQCQLDVNRVLAG
jgi:hypothetical protein